MNMDGLEFSQPNKREAGSKSKMRAPPLLCFLNLLLLIVCVVSVSETGLDARPETVRFDTGGLSRESFPKGFVFGAATSAYQVEGMASKDGRGPSIWDAFLRIPGIVASNATAEVAADQYHRYKEDVDIMANLNFDAYRFSISWSRIFPDGAGKVNWKGVAYYNRLIDYMLAKGITPFATIYHYDLPLALEQKYKGLLSRKVVKDYTNFAEFCFKTFGDRVKNWMTLNEPAVVSTSGYGNGGSAPGRCSKAYGNCTAGNSATEPYIAAHNMILCHAVAVQIYREKYQAHQKGRIGIVLDFIWYEPLTRRKADQYAAQRAIDFYLGWFLHPIVYVAKSGVPIGPRANSAWLYDVPWSLYKVLTYIKEYYGNPTVIITENGMDEPGNVTLPKGLHDTRRINFYRGYLTQLKKAIDDGVNVVGYFAWSLIDTFEWRLGYTTRFGIVYIDFKTLKRYPKMSAYWFRELLHRKKH
ncbi:PREDICTED: beta-glucosidase 44-like isoform X4 [Nelumbo nucifera]|uniref:Beta-glucosidase 44-like isoform X4 n=1 Tax=Nelumbo nucifera TaxID=4432 RepID=A0A1U8A8G4_NELNU|nr:PREDICTED: beta-glucosidase 44-like isoform X4 [Nelumbo nucifera]